MIELKTFRQKFGTIDFNNLEKYKNAIIKLNNIIDKVNQSKTQYAIREQNDLLCKMALVNFYLNKSIELGSQNNFYRYIINLVNEYEANKDKYNDIEGLYKIFILKCFDRLGWKQKVKRR